jgi:hypothetical protein
MKNSKDNNSVDPLKGLSNNHVINYLINNNNYKQLKRKTMKATIKLMTMMILILSVVISNSYGQQNAAAIKKLHKAQKNEFRKKVKQLKKKGWEIVGSRTMEVALAEFYLALDSSYSNQELDATCENCPTENLCDQKILSNLGNKYAAISSSYIRGRANSAFDHDEVNSNKDDLDKFFAGYDQIISKDVSQILNNTHITFSMQDDDGTYKYMVFYVINEDKAKELRKSASEQALELTELGIEWAKAIQEFVKDVPVVK